ncbi:MAG TPA: aldo/keto reductase [Nitriliruptorales bacterium]
MTRTVTEHTRTIGHRTIGAIGMGCAAMSLAGPTRDEALGVIHAALDAGVRMLDAAAAYTPDLASTGHNERLLSQAVRTWTGPREDVVIATKGGHRRVRDGLTLDAFQVCGRPDALRVDVEASLAALGSDRIELYYLHWPDPEVPIAESVGALEDLRREGKVGMVGLSNVTVEQLQQAVTAGRIDAVQNKFSPTATDSRPVIEWCERNGATFVAYSPLGGGAARVLEHAPAFGVVADARGLSVQRVVLAWELAQSHALVPIPGCRRIESVADSTAAMSLHLTVDELRTLDVP